MKTLVGVRGKIGLYGRSIGCTPACSLTPYVDLIIADRGFADLHTLAERKFFGKLAQALFKFLSMGWQVNNAFAFLFYKTHEDEEKQQLPSKKIHKLILCDKADEIIDVHASLMTGTAYELCHHQRRLRHQEL